MVSYSGPYLQLDDRALDKMLNSPSGDVGRHLHRLGTQILIEARRLVGVDTGRLRRSLYLKHARTTRGQYVQVGSNVNYAYMHHEGTRPHIINSELGRLIRFQSRGRVIYTRRVRHPGTRGRKYLTVPLRRVVR